MDDAELAALRARHSQWEITADEDGCLVAERGGWQILDGDAAALERRIAEHEKGGAGRGARPRGRGGSPRPGSAASPRSRPTSTPPPSSALRAARPPWLTLSPSRPTRLSSAR